MINKLFFLIVIVVSLLFIQCNREPLQTQKKVTKLSDYMSNDGAINLSIKGGKAPYKVEWSNSATDTVVNGLAAGEYYVTITDAKNRILVDTIDVTQPPYPVCIDADGNSYKTAIIGNQVWMLENLKASKLSNGTKLNYIGDDTAATTAGYLYTWEVAMADSIGESTQGVCPNGWHLPSDKEWFELTDFVNQEGVEFATVFEPQYDGFYNNGFNSQGVSESYWSSTQASDNAWKRYVHKNLTKVFRYHEKKANAISVRCVKDK